jgi:cupredoxin-like protein
MTGRYAGLLAGVFVLALALAFLGRQPRAQVARPGGPEPASPIARVAFEIEDKAIVPQTITVRKGERVIFRVTNRTSRPAKLALLGYSDVFPETTIAPGETVEHEIHADRPGDDFAWLLNESPAGTFVVAGSHLVDGHR